MVKIASGFELRRIAHADTMPAQADIIIERALQQMHLVLPGLEAATGADPARPGDKPVLSVAAGTL